MEEQNFEHLPGLLFLSKWEHARKNGVTSMTEISSPEFALKSQDSISNGVMDENWIKAISQDGKIDSKQQIIFSGIVSRDLSRIMLKEPKLSQRSCRLSRKFGSHRLLRLQVEGLEGSSVPEHKVESILSKFNPKLSEIRLFGISFKFLWDTKSQECVFEMLYFGEKGPLVSEFTVQDVYNWHLPIHGNDQIQAMKFLKRRYLCTSQTTPICQCSVVYVDDVLNYSSQVVMTDGCSGASLMLFIKIQEIMKLNFLPTVVQGRIGSAKGVWYMEKSINPHECVVYVRNSQKKYQLDSLDPFHNMFELCSVASPQSFSYLNTQFLSTLPAESLPITCDLLEKAFFEVERRFLSKDRLSILKLLEFIPSDSFDKRSAKFMLMSGIRMNEPYLIYLFGKILKSHYEHLLESFRIPVHESDRVMIIADPTGTLQPDECFYQRSVGKYRPEFGKDLLIARNPCYLTKHWLKLRNTEKSQLRDFFDVVILSSIGLFPPASFLNGGDYDGDCVFVTWHERLLRSFNPKKVSERLSLEDHHWLIEDNRTVSNVFLFENARIQDVLFDVLVKGGLVFNKVGLFEWGRVCILDQYGSENREAQNLAEITSQLIEKRNLAFILTKEAMECSKSLQCRQLQSPIWYKMKTSGRRGILNSESSLLAHILKHGENLVKKSSALKLWRNQKSPIDIELSRSASSNPTLIQVNLVIFLFVII